MGAYKFIKEGSEWYIDLPEYLANGGSKWLCAVTEYVFGDLPDEIFIKRVPGK
jgi:hypothetical protein